jgi:solute carrier family 25 S-adenosylmethionine transporter 26
MTDKKLIALDAVSIASQSDTPSLMRLGIQDGVVGAIAGFTTEFIFYGMDSYKIMRQTSPGGKVVYSQIFKGILPIVSLGAIPCYGVFFGFYRPIKKLTDDYFGDSSKLSILISSTLASVPSSICYVPADTMKKRMYLRSGKLSLQQTFASIVQESGYRGFFLGWQANVARDIPFTAIKMSLFEGMTLLYAQVMHKKEAKDCKFTNLETATIGFVSGTLTAICTNPLDCVNTRIKSGELEKFNIVQAHIEIIRKDGAKALFRGVVPRSLMVGVGATVFWYIYANTKNFV